jgi:uncharacterized protein YdeI (YjbR/CyaY-like superfamily)
VYDGAEATVLGSRLSALGAAADRAGCAVVQHLMVVKEDLEILAVESQAAWETWLDAHHGTSPGVWLKLIKKGSTRSGPTYAEAVEIGLCFGWIDGQGNRYDDDHWLQRFTPRTRRSRC